MVLARTFPAPSTISSRGEIDEPHFEKLYSPSLCPLFPIRSTLTSWPAAAWKKVTQLLIRPLLHAADRMVLRHPLGRLDQRERCLLLRLKPVRAVDPLPGFFSTLLGENQSVPPGRRIRSAPD